MPDTNPAPQRHDTDEPRDPIDDLDVRFDQSELAEPPDEDGAQDVEERYVDRHPDEPDEAVEACECPLCRRGHPVRRVADMTIGELRALIIDAVRSAHPSIAAGAEAPHGGEP